ncbi:MAG: zf-HC2 domain-containing protein [Acidobacteriota bacterium]
MDCKATRELLPFLLNGSLADSERREVLDHLHQCWDCREDLRRAAVVWVATESHPTAEILLDYAEGRSLDSFPRDLLEQHLATCDACSRAVEAASGAMTARVAWPGPPIDTAMSPPPRRPRRPLLGIAAGLVLLTASAGWLGSRLSPETPVANVHIAELSAVQERVRNLRIGRLEIPRSQAAALILIHPLDLAADESTDEVRFRIVVTDDGGLGVFTLEDLERSENGDFTLLIPADTLPLGSLSLELEQQILGEWSPVGEYQIQSTN